MKSLINPPINEKVLDFEKVEFTGLQIYYYFIDPRRLWYFSKGITMEHNSELVEIGKIITSESYKRERKEIQIGRIKIDFYRKNLEIHEVKKSSKFKTASRWQLIYYLWVLKNFGVECKGILNFPKERKTEKVFLTPEIEEKLLKILEEIKKIIELPAPPRTKISEKLKTSSYYELFSA